MRRVGAGAFVVRMLVGTVAVVCGFLLASLIAGALYAASCDPGVVTEYTARGNFSELKANQCSWVVPLRAFIEEVANRVGLLTSSNTWTNRNDFSGAQVVLPTAAPCDPALCDETSEYNTVCVDDTDPANPAQYLCGSTGWVLSSGSGGASGTCTTNVVDYGAIADDLIDDTVAIQAAIDALPTGFVYGSGSSKRGGSVCVPAGQFQIGGAGGHCTSSSPANKACTSDADCTGGAAVGYCCGITTNGRAVTLTGAGSFASEILMISNTVLNGVCITPGDNQSTIADVRIAKPNSAGSASGVGTGHGIIVQGQRTRLRNLNVDRWGGDCILVDGEFGVARSNDDRFDRIEGGACGGNGIHVWSHNTLGVGGFAGGDASTHFFSNIEMTSNDGYGILLGGSKGVFLNMILFSNALGGLLITGTNNHVETYCETATQPFCVKVAPDPQKYCVDTNLKCDTIADCATGACETQVPTGNLVYDLSGTFESAGQWVDEGLSNYAMSRGKAYSSGYVPTTVAPYACDATSAFNIKGLTYYDTDVKNICRCDLFDAGGPYPVPMWCPITTPTSSACTGGTTTDCGAEPADSGVGVDDAQLSTQDPAGTDWLVGGFSRNQLYGINKLSNVSIVSPANAACTASLTPYPCCTGSTTGTCIALANPTVPFAAPASGVTFADATVVTAATDTAVLQVTTSSGSLPTAVFASTASWFVTAQFRDPAAPYPQTITVEAKYDDGAGGTTWRTIATTTTNTATYWRADATFTSIASPYAIYAIRWTFTNWSGTGGARLLTVGLHHRSEHAFPPYLRRDGDVRSPMLGPLTWSTLLGSIAHLTGPADQSLVVRAGASQSACVQSNNAATNQTCLNSVGMTCRGSGNITASGDAQVCTGTVRNQTTNATQTTLYLNGSTATNRLSIPSDSTWLFTVNIVARRTDADNESAGYRCEGVIDNNAGTTALVGAITKTVLAEDTAAWDIDCVATDSTTDALEVKVTGEAAKTIDWVADATLTEVTG